MTQHTTSALQLRLLQAEANERRAYHSYVQLHAQLASLLPPLHSSQPMPKDARPRATSCGGAGPPLHAPIIATAVAAQSSPTPSASSSSALGLQRPARPKLAVHINSDDCGGFPGSTLSSPSPFPFSPCIHSPSNTSCGVRDGRKDSWSQRRGAECGEVAGGATSDERRRSDPELELLADSPPCLQVELVVLWGVALDRVLVESLVA